MSQININIYVLFKTKDKDPTRKCQKELKVFMAKAAQFLSGFYSQNDLLSAIWHECTGTRTVEEVLS